MKIKTYIQRIKKSCCFNTEQEAWKALDIEDSPNVKRLAQNYFHAKDAFEKADRKFTDLILNLKKDKRKKS